jgi:type IV pilus assembly protein PilE
MRGFTLIELMIVVTIVAILAGLAYPSYRNHVLRAQVVDATNGLSTLRADMERYYQDNRTYGPVGTTPNALCATPPAAGKFTLSCVSDATTFTLQAVGTGSTAGFTYTINQAGAQTTTITGVRGWTSGTSNCWITKAGQTC